MFDRDATPKQLRKWCAELTSRRAAGDSLQQANDAKSAEVTVPALTAGKRFG